MRTFSKLPWVLLNETKETGIRHIVTDMELDSASTYCVKNRSRCIVAKVYLLSFLFKRRDSLAFVVFLNTFF